MPAPFAQPLLNVDKIVVDFQGPDDSHVRVLDGVSFNVDYGMSLVVLGESGSGKTVLSRALTGLFLPEQRPAVSGTVLYEGRDLLREEPDQLLRIRRSGIRYVFQDPMQALNPVARVGAQLRLAAKCSRSEFADLAATLDDVGLSSDVLKMFPFQLSVGMAQRVALAMAFIASPKLLIADEPTSALDVTLRLQVMDIMSRHCKTKNVGVLLITHDLGVAQRYGDSIVLLHRGQAVETAPVRAFFHQPFHPYARFLKELQPVMGKPLRRQDIPESDRISTGCRFSSHCPLVRERCRNEEPSLDDASDGRKVRCFFWK